MLAVLLAVAPLCPSVQAAGSLDRYFLMGSGAMHLVNHRNGREAQVRLRHVDGSINTAALTEVDRVFAYPGGINDHISPRMLFALSYFADRAAPGRIIHIESAYRSPEYNDGLRKQGANAARTSTHLDGLALDFWIEGVDGKKLWQTIREKNCCGVGHYGGKTIHFDAGRPRFWEAATSGTRSPEPDYNRHLYLATDFDRYQRGDIAHLMLSSVAAYGFGLRPAVEIMADSAQPRPVASTRLAQAATSTCHAIGDRRAARFLSVSLPPDLPSGRYRLQLFFCDKPFAQMPDAIVSNPFELVR